MRDRERASDTQPEWLAELADTYTKICADIVTKVCFSDEDSKC